MFQVSVAAAECTSALFSSRPIGNLTDSHNQLISDTHFCEKPPGCVTLGRFFFYRENCFCKPESKLSERRCFDRFVVSV
jgi:hypothetical protein